MNWPPWLVNVLLFAVLRGLRQQTLPRICTAPLKTFPPRWVFWWEVKVEMNKQHAILPCISPRFLPLTSVATMYPRTSWIKNGKSQRRPLATRTDPSKQSPKLLKAASTHSSKKIAYSTRDLLKTLKSRFQRLLLKQG